MAYPNMAAEMARHGITQSQIAEAVGKRPETVSNWMQGKTGIPVDKMFVIRDTFFPNLSIDYLADSTPLGPTPAGVA